MLTLIVLALVMLELTSVLFSIRLLLISPPITLLFWRLLLSMMVPLRREPMLLVLARLVLSMMLALVIELRIVLFLTKLSSRRLLLSTLNAAVLLERVVLNTMLAFAKPS